MADHGGGYEGCGVIKKKATVTLEDGTVFAGVRIMPGDVVRFERHFGVRIESVSGNELMEHALFLGWSPLNRKGMTPLTFDEFCDVVESVDISADGEASPTDPVPSEDDSSS